MGLCRPAILSTREAADGEMYNLTPFCAPGRRAAPVHLRQRDLPLLRRQGDAVSGAAPRWMREWDKSGACGRPLPHLSYPPILSFSGSPAARAVSIRGLSLFRFAPEKSISATCPLFGLLYSIGHLGLKTFLVSCVYSFSDSKSESTKRMQPDVTRASALNCSLQAMLGVGSG